MTKALRTGLTVILIACPWAGRALAQEPPPAEGPAQATPPGPEEAPAPPGADEEQAAEALPPPLEAVASEAPPSQQAPAAALEEPAAKQPKPPPTVFPPAKYVAPEQQQSTALRTTTGIGPTAPDFGGEADLVSTANRQHAPPLTKKWQYSLRGFLRAPMHIGLGPRNDGGDGLETHAPPRIVGLSRYDWQTVALAPHPTASVYVSIRNARIDANIILTTDTLWDAGYKDLVNIGGIAQAYVTLKFPQAFGEAGGLAATIGAFSNRYGNAGPRQESSGYYQTQLFGRTRVAGFTLTEDFNLTPDIDLVFEQGFGSKIEPVPWRNPGDERTPRAPWLPEQGPRPQGSNFVGHAHGGLYAADWLQVGAHYLYSYTPDDFTEPAGLFERRPGSVSIFGPDVHVDSPKFGSLYLGYSHLEAKNVLPLSGGVEVLHSADGLGLTENYFNPGGRLDNVFFNLHYESFEGESNPPVDDGVVDTVLFQYSRRLAPLLGWPDEGPDLFLALFGMFNQIDNEEFTQTRLKAGVDLGTKLAPELAITVRADHVLPDGPDADAGYTAVSPRLILNTNWISREYVMFGYTRYLHGKDVMVYQPPALRSGANPPRIKPDENLFVIQAIASF